MAGRPEFELAQARELAEVFAEEGVEYLFIGKAGAILLGYYPVANLRDIIASKRASNRRKDLLDIDLIEGFADEFLASRSTPPRTASELAQDRGRRDSTKGGEGETLITPARRLREHVQRGGGGPGPQQMPAHPPDRASRGRKGLQSVSSLENRDSAYVPVTMIVARICPRFAQVAAAPHGWEIHGYGTSLPELRGTFPLRCGGRFG